MNVLVIHGPQLDRLGSREPQIYGSETLDEVNAYIEEVAAELGITVDIRQSGSESEIIGFLEEASSGFDGVVMNPAVYSHYSRALAATVKAVRCPVIEVHLSNIHAREPWRRRSVTAEDAAGVIAGFKADSYALALRALGRMIA